MEKTQISSVNLGFWKDDESRPTTSVEERVEIFQAVAAENFYDLKIKIDDMIFDLSLTKTFEKPTFYSTKITRADYRAIFGDEIGIKQDAKDEDFVSDLVLENDCKLSAITYDIYKYRFVNLKRVIIL